MSLSDARSFVERVTADEALRRELEGALRDNPESSAVISIELGGRYGLTYTADELTTVLAERQTAGTELHDSQLESASGGSPIAVASQAYQAWMTCLKSMADSKAQAQQELARFR